MQRILIIEDDEAIAAIERDYLEIDGFAVETAPDGESGLARGLTGQFDLILLDLMLPGLDGFAVCRRLRDALDATGQNENLVLFEQNYSAWHPVQKS